MEYINVVSLFNGMGCIWLALDQANIKVNKRYSSEIEKYPNQANDLLYPDTVQLGDVRNVKGSDLGFIDLLAGGSPCQSFSFAGKRKGMAAKEEFIPPTLEQYSKYLESVHPDLVEKDYEDYVEYCRLHFESKNKEVIEILTLNHYLKLKEQNFEFEGQSYLFWEYMRILEELRVINPNIKFLLENVMMGSKWQKILTQAIGINPIQINSALVSAQNRNRLYWTNIASESFGLFGDLHCSIPQPKDKGILLKDVLETFEMSSFQTKFQFDDYISKYYLSDAAINRINRTNNGERCFDNENKALCLAAGYHKLGRDNQYVVHNMMPRSGNPAKGGTGHLTRSDGKTYCLDTGNTNAVEIVVGGDFDFDGNFRERENGKSGTLRARAREDESCSQLAKINENIRRLTPRECGRLQTVPEDKLDILLSGGISDSQLYKMFGNGWTILVISHILEHFKN